MRVDDLVVGNGAVGRAARSPARGTAGTSSPSSGRARRRRRASLRMKRSTASRLTSDAMNRRGSRCVWMTRASGYSANSCGERRQVPGRLQQPRGAVRLVRDPCDLERLQHPAVQAVHAPERLEVLELPAGEARRVVEHRPVRPGEVVQQRKCTHSHGRSLASSCIVMNSGWMSAQNSCSHSASSSRRRVGRGVARRRPAADAAPPTRTACADCGSSARSSSRIVVPVRGGPTTNSGASIGSRGSRACAAQCSCSRSQVCRTFSTSARVSTRPSRWSSASVSIAVSSRR